MFKKTNLYLKGYMYNIRIKKISEEDLYEKKDYQDFDGEEVLNEDFISLNNLSLKINDNENSENLSDNSNAGAFINKEELIEENNSQKVDNLISENLLDSIQEEFIVMQIENYEFESPKIKVTDKNFKKYKLKMETTDLEALTDFIIDEEVVSIIKYNEKELNYKKQGLIFTNKINKNLLKKEIATFNIEDYNPCLENKYKIK